MYFKTLGPLFLQHKNFNCKLIRILLLKNPIEKSYKLTNYYGSTKTDEDNTEYILKGGNKETGGTVEYKEIKFLSDALLKPGVNNFIVTIIGSINNTFGNDCAVVLERGLMDVQQFLDKEQSTPKLPVLERFAKFFIAVLTFLETEKIVYCDWKFENILVFDEKMESPSALKLCDFGAIQNDGVKVLNPQNCNPLFSSPYLTTCQTTITPSCRDDWISVCYLFYKLNGKILPWEHLQNIPNKDFIFTTVLYQKTSPAYKLDFENTIYWPDQKYFIYGNFFNISK